MFSVPVYTGPSAVVFPATMFDVSPANVMVIDASVNGVPPNVPVAVVVMV